MADSTVNEWFKGAEEPLSDLAGMLVALDRQGKIPSDMRTAIAKHAANAAECLPLSIAGISAAIASAHAGGGGFACNMAANAAWGIASIADMAGAMNMLRAEFGAPHLPPSA